MLDLIRDLYGHQAWADSELWHFLDQAPAAQQDKKILELLNHIHAVQRFFLSAAKGTPISREELKKELPLAELRASFAAYHSDALQTLFHLPETQLTSPVDVPWFLNLHPKTYEVLVQASTHSVHHRAQIATLIRQHGGNPKPLDFIMWVANGRPSPQWQKT